MPQFLTTNPICLGRAKHMVNQDIPLLIAHSSRTLLKSQQPAENSKASWARPVAWQLPLTKPSILLEHPLKHPVLLLALLQSNPSTHHQWHPLMSLPSLDLPFCFQPLWCPPFLLSMLTVPQTNLMTLPLTHNPLWISCILVSLDLGFSAPNSSKHICLC